MYRQSFSIREDQNEFLEELIDSNGLDNKSEALRHAIDEAQRIGELEDKIDELETEVERLKNEKQTILAQREEHGELVKYVQEERSLQRRRENRRRERESADILTKAKWAIFGRKYE